MSSLRPKQILKQIGRTWPEAWQQVKQFRAGKGKDLPDWPDWCYIPIAAGVAIATQGNDSKLHQAILDFKLSPAVVTAAAAWRVSQGVYRFDADLYNSLTSQPLDGNVPCEILKRMPEWCVYIETINGTYFDKPMDGFWAHLEYDVNTGTEELRFVFLFLDGKTSNLPIHLGDYTLEESLDKMRQLAEKNADKLGLPSVLPPELGSNIAVEIMPYLQLVLYLCAENADMPKIQHPQTRVRMSGQVDVPRETRHWTVGERIGAGIRKYRNQETQEHQGGTHASPRAHIRRAHWHSFWTGPRDGQRKLILRWLPPIPVGVDDDGELPAVIHKIK